MENTQENLALRLVDLWLSHQSRFMNLPGFQVCIRNRGKVVFSKAYGFANLKKKIPLKTTDLFRIASHTKSFTACVFLQLVENGQIQLSQSIVDFFPELKKHKDKRFRIITVRDLLSNRSGIFRDGLDSNFWDMKKSFPTESELMQEILASNLVFNPNERTKYSNVGFCLLGMILEKVMSMPFAHILDQLIFKQLKDATFLCDYESRHESKFSAGHTPPLWGGECKVLKHSFTKSMVSAAGLCANAQDTNLFFDKLLRENSFLSATMHNEMKSLNWFVENMPTDRYGLGLLFTNFPDVALIGHAGGYPGFATYTGFWKDTDYVFSAFFNTNSFRPVNIVRSVAQIIQKVRDTFTPREAQEAMIGGPFVSLWGGQVCAVTGRKGVCIFLGDWIMDGKIFTLNSKNGKDYYCENQIWFDALGEKIHFVRDKKGAITAMTWGSSQLSLEKDFQEFLPKITA